MKDKLRKVFKNEYIFSILIKFITFALGIIQSVLIARYLGAELKGVNAYISSIASVGSIVITFGMHEAYPYFRKKFGKEAIYQDFVSLIMYLYAVLLLGAILLAVFLPVSLELRAVFVLIPLLGYSRIVGYVTLIETPNIRNAWWMVISIIDIVYVALLWIFVERNIYWGISLLLFADVLKCVVYTILLHTRPRFSSKIPKLFTELLKYGFFPMLALLMTTLNYRIDVLMLRQYDTITDAMIGVYSLGISLSDKIVLIPDTLKGVLVSKLAKGAETEEVAKVCRLGLWASVVLCLLIFALGKPVIWLMYGAEYEGAYSVILITAVGILAVIFFKLIAQYNIVNKKQYLNVILLSIAIVVDVVLNLIFIPLWGIQGAAFATSAGNVVCGIVFILYFSRVSGIPVSKIVLLQKSDLRYARSLFGKKGKKADPKESSAEEKPQTKSPSEP